jgi:2',3'-cyclic-nucleotide 2'-phosphodiesterase (5'-nucleotidase family)
LFNSWQDFQGKGQISIECKILNFDWRKTKMKMMKRVSIIAIVLMLVLSMAAIAAPVKLTIVHTNDTHGRIASYAVTGVQGEVGGFAKLYTLVQQIRKDVPNVLLLDAGDTLHGTNLVNLQKGLNVVGMMNGLGYDAMVPGNHDFNYGYAHLLDLSKLADFKVLSANVEKDKKPVFAPYTIIEKEGVRVAIIGVSAEETPIVTHPNNVIGLNFSNPVEKVKNMVAEVKDKADIIVVLSHTGYEVDQKIAKEVPGIHLIIGGHTHTQLDKVTVVNNVIIAQSGEHGKNLGRIDLSIEDGKIAGYAGYLIPIDGKVAKNSAINQIIKVQDAKLSTMMNEVVGTSSVVLQGERGQVRTQETNLGNLVADVMLGACKADLAVTNGGGIRASINSGEITVGEIFTTLPFDNTLVVIEVTGAQLKAALENSVSKAPGENGAFLQVAGIKFSYDVKKPAGQRVLDVTVQGKALDLNKKYLVATNDFTAAGGDGYTSFKEGKVVYQSGLYLRDLMVSYIKAQKTIDAKVEGRVNVIK